MSKFSIRGVTSKIFLNQYRTKPKFSFVPVENNLQIKTSWALIDCKIQQLRFAPQLSVANIPTQQGASIQYQIFNVIYQFWPPDMTTCKSILLISMTSLFTEWGLNIVQLNGPSLTGILECLSENQAGSCVLLDGRQCLRQRFSYPYVDYGQL